MFILTFYLYLYIYIYIYKLIEKCESQNHLAECSRTKTIKRDEKLWIAADKTTNFYRVDTDLQYHLIQKSITKSYKKVPADTIHKIISKEKQIAESLNLDDRVDAFPESESFVNLKDHKPNFANNPSCRLINPAKSEIGIISQKILRRINSEVVSTTGLNQWKNTQSVIEWFNKIPNK